MSHDTDKLIRQLSLVAYLMAERRPITARDVKSHVEGYSEMSDEAFARRFYSDRAELLGLGVPLESQRDEFTGEELYTLRSEQYFLPPLSLEDEELAALQTSLYMLEGSFAYAEPLRLALQNLTLGRPGFRHAPTPTAERVEVLDPDYSPEMAGRLSKLEGAISKGRTVRFDYWNPSRDETRERTVNPYALLREPRGWYVVARDLEDDRAKTWKVSRIRGEIRFATRRERDFRIPAGFDVEGERLPPDWQIPRPASGVARIRVAPETAWWVERLYGEHGRLDGDAFVTEYADLNRLAGWILRQDGRAEPLEPAELRDEVARALDLIAERHAGPPPVPAPAADQLGDGAPERPGGPVAPERFAILQALLAYLLAACGEERSAAVEARELVERFHVPHEQLEEYLSLLNLVNFGGGCYTVYAQLQGDTVRVDKEMYGDTFRAPPRLTPLEARAIRLALEFVGPTIAADARSPLERVRAKLEETFGLFELPQTPEPHLAADEEDLVATLSEGIRERRLVDLEYLKEEEQEPTTHLVEPYSLERRLPHWYVHTWDRTRDAERSFRLDRMRSARLTRKSFQSRAGFEPHWLRGARTVRVWYSPAVARWQVERGAALLADGSAIAELAVGDADWLVSEIFSACGEAVVVEPDDLRARVGKRAAALASELGLAKAGSRTGATRPRAGRA
jgi:predicted DNA-binding transcriptional regulator YafY